MCLLLLLLFIIWIPVGIKFDLRLLSVFSFITPSLKEIIIILSPPNTLHVRMLLFLFYFPLLFDQNLSIGFISTLRGDLLSSPTLLIPLAPCPKPPLGWSSIKKSTTCFLWPKFNFLNKMVFQAVMKIIISLVSGYYCNALFFRLKNMNRWKVLRKSTR